MLESIQTKMAKLGFYSNPVFYEPIFTFYSETTTVRKLWSVINMYLYRY